jgi:hypothetical protein
MLSPSYFVRIAQRVCRSVGARSAESRRLETLFEWSARASTHTIRSHTAPCCSSRLLVRVFEAVDTREVLFMIGDDLLASLYATGDRTFVRQDFDVTTRNDPCRKAKHWGPGWSTPGILSIEDESCVGVCKECGCVWRGSYLEFPNTTCTHRYILYACMVYSEKRSTIFCVDRSTGKNFR